MKQSKKQIASAYGTLKEIISLFKIVTICNNLALSLFCCCISNCYCRCFFVIILSSIQIDLLPVFCYQMTLCLCLCLCVYVDVGVWRIYARWNYPSNLFKISKIAFQFKFECPATTKVEGAAWNNGYENTWINTYTHIETYLYVCMCVFGHEALVSITFEVLSSNNGNLSNQNVR